MTKEEIEKRIEKLRAEKERLSLRDSTIEEVLQHLRAKRVKIRTQMAEVVSEIEDLGFQLIVEKKAEERKKKVKSEKEKKAPSVQAQEQTAETVAESVDKEEPTTPEKSATDKFNERYSKAIQNGTAKEQDNSINN